MACSIHMRALPAPPACRSPRRLVSHHRCGEVTAISSVKLESARAGVKFGGSNDFQVELGRRVEAFFLATGRRQRDCWQMYLKTAILVGVFATAYGLLLFGAQTWWQAL